MRQSAFSKKLYAAVDERQVDFDFWMGEFNAARPLQCKWRSGKTLLQTFLDAPFIPGSEFTLQSYRVDSLWTVEIPAFQ